MHTSSIPVNFIYILGHIFSGHLQERCFGENFIWRICWTGFRLNACFLLLSCIRVASHSWGSNTSNFSITEVRLEKCMCKNQFSSVQSLSRLWLFATPWTAACQAFLSLTNSRSLLRLMSIKLAISPNHLILCHPLPLLPSVFPSIRVFSNESVLRIRWPKYWSFSLNISPSNEYSGLISFTMDCFDLLALQGTLKSLLQHYSSKASILWRSAFFIGQFSHPYLTTGKAITLTR